MSADGPDAPIMFIAGTRPEAVKLAPLMLDLQARGAGCVLVATGQHRDLFDETLAGFGLTAHHDLGVMAPLPDAVVGRLVPLLAERVRRQRPAWVVVQGDTSSTLAGALAARYAGAALAHVEAGLRTGSEDPHPEEMHRKLVAQMAQLHFAPTPGAAAALAAEGVGGSVHVTGNSGIDALLIMQSRLAGDAALARAARAAFAPVPRGRPWLLATLHRRESRGAVLDGMLAALAELAGEAEVIMPVHPAVAAPVQAALGRVAGVHLMPPLPYPAFVALMGEADLVLTDSGGVQEEAPAIGLPCLVLRSVTERREGVASGNALLVGREPAGIVAAARRVLAGGRLAIAAPALPYGNGNAARAINDLLLRQAVPSSPRRTGSSLRLAAHRQ